MPVQRKIFRIEQGAAMGPRTADAAGTVALHHEFMAEIKALRSLIEPRGAVSREAMEQGRAQIAEAQACKAELELIYTAIRRTREQFGSLGMGAASMPSMARAAGELEAIVAGTEQATQQVLTAAEDIDQCANTLSAALKSEHEKGLASDIRDRVVQIFEACNFQDLTGQRVGRVIELLEFVEAHTAKLMEIWQRVEQFKPVVLEAPLEGDARFLNGPKLAGATGHSSQDDIDAMFEVA